MTDEKLKHQIFALQKTVDNALDEIDKSIIDWFKSNNFTHNQIKELLKSEHTATHLKDRVLAIYNKYDLKEKDFLKE